MGKLRRVVLPLFLCLSVCVISTFLGVNSNVAISVFSQQYAQKTVIIDAGHAELPNTID